MAETGKIFNTLEFGNVNSGDYGVYITGTGVYNAPARAVEMVSVPGRNGDVPIDMGHWDNIEVRYKCGLFGIDQSEMGEALMKFRNAIASQIGYQRLSDSYNPNEFRLGLFMAGFEFDAVSMNRAGEFELKFNCKPQRFLTDGEEMIDVKSDWSNLKTASDEVVTFEVEDDAAANYTQFKSLVADINPIQDLHGYDHPWVGGAGKNKFQNTLTSQTLNGVTFTVNADGTVATSGTASGNISSLFFSQNVELLPSTNYILSGCPSGGTQNTYRLVLLINGEQIVIDYGNEASFTTPETITSAKVYPVILNGTNMNGKVFKPMIRLATETDPTYEPYSNLCPISGWDSVEASVVGKNRWNPNLILTIGGTITESDGVYYFPRHFDNVPRRMWENTRGYVGQVVLSYDTMHGGNDGGDATLFQFMYTDGTRTRPSDYSNSQPNVWRKIVVVSDPNKTVASVAYGYYRSNRESWIKNPQIELGTEATAYEPYQGTTHTATFDETVYGGDYEFIGGSGNVELAKVVFDGSNDEYWSVESYNDGTKCSSRFPDIKADGNKTKPLLTNMFKFRMYSVADYGQITNVYWNTSNLEMTIPQKMTAEEWRAFLQNNPLEVVYSLAEPRTIQLDPQTINTLVGVNNVWADSGDVSVEYGVRPGVLVNPTQYESSPVIEIEGTGSIGLNDYLIAIDGGSVGEVELASERRVEPIMAGSYLSTITETIDMATTMSLLEDGDAFNISTLTASWLMGDTTKETYTIAQQPTDGVASIETATSPRVSAIARFSQLAFVKGEAKTFAEEFIISGQSSHGTGSVTFSVGVDYDGSHTLTISYGVAIHPLITGVFRSGSYSDIGEIVGNSSKQTFSGQVIIDSETGDAYRIEDGTYISLNKYIQLGAQLPTLRPGANIITYDDTITSLKIAPRWWRL